MCGLGRRGRTSTARASGGAFRAHASATAAHDYRPWWALRAHLLARLGRDAEARAAYERAAGLTQAPVVRAFLFGRRDRLGPGPWLGA